MKKTILFLLLCAAMAFAAGCGGNDEPAPVEAPAEAPSAEPAGEADVEESVAAPSAQVPAVEAEEDYPALAAVPLDGLDLEEGGSDSLSAQFPAGKWVFDLSMAGVDFMIYDVETLESEGNTININVIIAGDYNVELTQADLDGLVKEIGTMSASGMEIQSAEMRSLDGEPVIYMETVTRITEEMLELTIESGGLTEEQVEAMGGREALLSVPPTYQIQLYGIVEGKMLVLTGSYYDEADKDRLLETMTIVLETADVK